MATLVLSAVGTAIGGPIGGAIGALIGNQVDQAVFKPKGREGPRLKELSVTTSSYGTPIPRHFGIVRAAGSIIWSTDLVESSEVSGGGKGQPSTTTYTYTVSFAVALSSRPVSALGRIWADGNLLRGEAGDLKVGGTLRFHQGYGDQIRDPLLESAEGSLSPAFRGLAYCVFEDLQLSDFGNRIPALTFEIIAENGTVELVDILQPIDRRYLVGRELSGLTGYSDDGGPLAATLEVIDQLYPLSCDISGDRLSIQAEDFLAAPATTLPEPVVATTEESFGANAGIASQRLTGLRGGPDSVRYYDIDRDYQPGVQHAARRAVPGRQEVIEFPGALSASDARGLVEAAARRSASSQDLVAWRISEIDPALTPGTIVQLPDRAGVWRIIGWEWRADGLELELLRISPLAQSSLAADGGRSLDPSDDVATPTELAAFELPADGINGGNERLIFAAASSQSDGWTGAALYADHNGSLVPLGSSGKRRSIIGTTLQDLPPATPHLLDRSATIDVQLVADDFVLTSLLVDDLAQGANRALIGEELVQFASAEPLGNGQWRLAGILRGRGGTEHTALGGIPTGADFALLDEKPLLLDHALVGAATTIAAIGLVDPAPVNAQIIGLNRTLKPLMPVHPRIFVASDGALTLCWTRRARGAWAWSGAVEPALGEQSELYEVGLGDPDQPSLTWQVSTPMLEFDSASMSQLSAAHSGKAFWVRQIGTHHVSDALYLTTLA